MYVELINLNKGVRITDSTYDFVVHLAMVSVIFLSSTGGFTSSGSVFI